MKWNSPKRAWFFDNIFIIAMGIGTLIGLITLICFSFDYDRVKTEADKLEHRIDQYCEFERIQLDGLAEDLTKQTPTTVTVAWYQSLASTSFREATVCINDDRTVDPDDGIFACAMRNVGRVGDYDFACMRSTVDKLRPRIARPK